MHALTMNPEGPPPSLPPKRRPGRPPVYVFTKPDAELSENERRLKGAVLKRRIRQNRSYHRKKRLRQLQAHEVSASAGASSSGGGMFRNPPPLFNSTHDGPPLASPSSLTIPPLALPSLASVAPPTSSSSALLRVPPPVLTPLAGVSSGGTTTSRPALSSFSLSPNVPSCGALSNGAAPAGSTALCSISSPNPLPVHQHRLSDPFSPSSFPSPTASPKQHDGSNSGPHVQSTMTGGDADDRVLQQLLDMSAERAAGTSAVHLRHAAPHPVMAGDLATSLSTLPRSCADVLPQLTLFPASFDVNAAHSILVPSSQICMDVSSFASNILQPLVNASLVRRLPSGRYVLNAVARALLVPAAPTITAPAAHRFLNHFTQRLLLLDARTLARNGHDRITAMRLYDAEKPNMKAALELARGMGSDELLSFLSHAATIMRYFTAPLERTTILESALHDLEARNRNAGGSTHDRRIGPSLSMGYSTDHGIGHDTRTNETADAEARVRLALSEAYFDMLSIAHGRAHLSTAISVMACGTGRSAVGVASSIVALLLLAEVRISDRQFEDASKLLGQALKALREADLQKSTFAVCSLLSLASVYNETEERERALQTVQRALDILKELGFEQMPIYADALRTLGMVHLAMGDTKQAQTLFFSALDVLDRWTSRSDWQDTPVQHCAHLDVFLIESIAQTYVVQNRHDEAHKLLSRARQQRQERHLKMREGDDAHLLTSLSTSHSRELFTRHLY